MPFKVYVAALLALFVLNLGRAEIFTDTTQSAVGATGTSSTFGITAPSFTATAASGSVGYSQSTGAQLNLGGGANDYFFSDGTTIMTLAGITAAQVNSSGGVISSTGTATLSLRGGPANGATAVATRLGSLNTLTTAGAVITRFCADTPATCASAVVDIKHNGGLTQTGVAFAALGTPANGTLLYCTDCTIANPCADSGTGAFAKRLAGAWVCN